MIHDRAAPTSTIREQIKQCPIAMPAITTKTRDATLAFLAFLPAGVLLADLLDNPIPIVYQWCSFVLSGGWVGISLERTAGEKIHAPPVGSQLLAYVIVAAFGYFATNSLVPKIKTYTLRKGICGKDLGKKGSSIADKDVPEALGIVPGATFLVCLILVSRWICNIASYQIIGLQFGTPVDMLHVVFGIQ